MFSASALMIQVVLEAMEEQHPNIVYLRAVGFVPDEEWFPNFHAEWKKQGFGELMGSPLEIMDQVKSRTSRSYMQAKAGLDARLERGFVQASMANVIYGNGNGNNQFQHAEEQMTYYKGYPYSIIRTISNRISRQPLCVAQVNAKLDTANESIEGVRRVYQKGILYKQFGGEGGELKRAGKQMTPAYVKNFLPDTFKNRGSDTDVLEDHAILDAFEDPNPIMTKSTLMTVTIASLELTGRAFWLFVRPEDSDDGKAEIWYVPPSWVKPIHHEGKLFKSWEIRPPTMSEPIPYDGDDIVYFYYPDPADPINGAISPLQAQANCVIADESIEVSQRKAFANGINPGIALVVGRPPEMGEGDDRPFLRAEQRNQIIAQVKAQYRGVLNADEPLILDGLIRDVKRINMSPREMDWLNSGMSTKNRLAQGWGVNPISMGEIEGANRASSAVADDHLVANVINPRIELYSEILTRACRKIWKDPSLLVYFEKAKSEDADYDLDLETRMYDRAVLSKNQWLAAHGKPPLAQGDVAYVGGIEIPIIPEAESSNVERVTRVMPKFGTKAGFKSVANHLGVNGQGGMYLVQLNTAAFMFQRDLSHFFVEMGESAKAKLAMTTKSDNSPFELMNDAIPEHIWLEKLQQMCKPHMLKIATTGALMEWTMHTKSWHQFQTKGFFDDVYGLPGKIATNVGTFIQNLFSLDYWKGIIVTGKDRAAKSLEDARTKDIGRDATDSAINSVFGLTSSSTKAKQIAEVESGSALGGGQHQARMELGRSGIVTRKQWWTKLDNKVREFHAEAHGQIVGVYDHFYVGGEYCDYPKAANLSPGNRINCRCIALSLS